MKKIILLLGGGLVLGLSKRPDINFRIIKSFAMAWKDINREVLYDGIRKLYQSKLIDYKENEDGTTTIILSEKGKRKVLQYDIDKMKIKSSNCWDGLWRMVVFDVPETLKNGRNALSGKIKELGFYPMQKSVFIYPYQCKNEIDFIVEFFGLKKYVRFLTVKETDIDLHLKSHFGLK